MMDKVQDKYTHTLDALQSYRPFYPELLKLYAKQFHLGWTDRCKNYWNTRNEEFGVGEIFEFLEMLNEQEELINSYGMKDPRYAESYNELVSTFCVRIYKATMPLTLKVLTTMKTDFEYEGSMCVSKGHIDFFKFISETIGLARCLKLDSVCFGILGLVYK